MMQSLPNYITLFRIAMIPAIYLCFQLPGHFGDWMTLTVFVTAAISDFFDGWLARKFDVSSGFGRMLDPIADKLMVATSLVLLVDGDIVQGIHIIAALVILSREILVSGMREFLMEMRTTLPVSTAAKVKTAFQMTAIGFLLSNEAGEAAQPGAHEIGLTLLWIAVGMTLWTGYDYLRQGMTHAKWRD